MCLFNNLFIHSFVCLITYLCIHLFDYFLILCFFCIHTHTYIYIYIYIYIHTHAHTHTHTHTHTHIFEISNLHINRVGS